MAVPDQQVEEERTFQQRCHPDAGVKVNYKGNTMLFYCFACRRKVFELTLGLETHH